MEVKEVSFFKTFKGPASELETEEKDEDYESEGESMGAIQEPAVQRAALPAQAKTDTIISKGTVIIGTLKGEGAVKIEGKVEGEIILNGTITVASSGIIKGPVAANVLRVFGNIEGNVTARERLCLEKDGYIQGDVETSALIVEDGGQLNGRIAMLETPKKTASNDALSELQFGKNYTVGLEESEQEGAGAAASRDS
ncbi:polymer-forming cytoskeletal protein [uncultured Intestinimonas sp.]|uniref:bactofilin family protein n=1 Tax=uncultured Intestinimonas sp. TaxID=1689265 RepID=UPI0025CE42C1|nr:polymer-forming cytoskeletal protein [uncultured Intestinimonas sp.]